MEYSTLIFDTLSFIIKAFFVTLSVGAVLVLFASLAQRAKHHKDTLEIEDLNEKLDHMRDSIRGVALDRKSLKKLIKSESKAKKKTDKLPQKHVYVLTFEGDLRASQVEHLRDEVTAVLSIAQPEIDEVVLRLESPGGMVHGYGLAAAQLLRFKKRGIFLTVAVDKVAASGGYMMAATGQKILAAPFAILGSIGVLAQLPNVHRLLKKHDIDYEEVTAGEYKRTVSVFAENTEKGRQKFVEQLEDTHVLFKDFIRENRPQVDISQVATGEYWFGRRARELGLVDDIMTSDEYLLNLKDSARIFKVQLIAKKRWSEKVMENLAMGTQRGLEKVFQSFLNRA